MLRPLIVIGCGGSGVKTVQLLRSNLQKILNEAGWKGEFPQAWQFIGIDMGEQWAQDSTPIPGGDYLDIWQSRTYQDVVAVMDRKHPLGSQGVREMFGWRPDPREMSPLRGSPTQHRAQGRMYGLAAMESLIAPRLSAAFDSIKNGVDEFRQISNLLQWGSNSDASLQDPYVVVVGSMAGGTGSGVMLDIHEMIQRISPNYGQFSLVYSESIFDYLGSSNVSTVRANSLAFMSEMLNLSWDEGENGSALISKVQKSKYRARPLMFVVESANQQGLTVATSPNESFQLVASWLTELATSGILQDSLIWPLSNHNLHYSKVNDRVFGFEKSSVPNPPGAIYSLGHSVLSVGRDRFQEYATKLLQREVISFLLFNFTRLGLQDSCESGSSSSSTDRIRALADGYLQPFLSGLGFSTSDQLQNLLIELITQEATSQELSNKIIADLDAVARTKTSSKVDSFENVVSAFKQIKVQSAQQNSVICRQKIDDWKLHILEVIAESLNRDIARVGIPTTHAVLKATQLLIEQAAGQIRVKGAMQGKNAVLMDGQAIERLKKDQKRRFGRRRNTADAFIASAVKTIMCEISAQNLDILAAELEDLSIKDLGNLIKDIEQLAFDHQNQNPKIDEWPRIDGQVPSEFRPRSFEICLEESDTWPESLKRLILRLQAIDGDRKEDPIAFARSSIIQGGYEVGEGVVAKSFIRVFVDPERIRNRKLSESSIRIEWDVQDLEERVVGWLHRPGLGFNEFVNDSLSNFLADNDSFSRTDTNDVNYGQRLEKFAECLQMALSLYQPLIQVDEKISKEASQELRSIVIFQLPFFQNHPAYEVSLPLIRASSPNHFDMDYARSRFFASDNSITSIKFNSFVKYPLSPIALRYFTETQGSFMGRLGTSVERDHAFKWRRSRKLSEFIPLPTELRQAAIRGFAVGRMLGYITIDTQKAIKISGKDCEYEFPRLLITESGPENLLPSLLESMPLCFADVPKLGQEAFGAYRELISIGHGATPRNPGIENECLRFIDTGKRLRVPVDTERAERMSGESPGERKQKMSDYLEMNLRRYAEIGYSFSFVPNPDSIPAADKLTIELLNELMAEYSHVLETIQESRDNFDF